MDTPNSINLISPQAKLPKSITDVAPRLQRISIISLIVLLISAIFIGLFYSFLIRERTSLVVKRDTLRTEIKARSDIEGILISLKERIKISNKLLSSQIHWASIIDREIGRASCRERV